MSQEKIKEKIAKLEARAERFAKREQMLEKKLGTTGIKRGKITLKLMKLKEKVISDGPTGTD